MVRRLRSRLSGARAGRRTLAGVAGLAMIVMLVPSGFAYPRPGRTEGVTIEADGERPDVGSYPTLSADGRYVAFFTSASNVVPGDTNETWDVFVRDREAGTVERVSLSSEGTQGNGSSVWPSMSADGRHIAFHSRASNLVPGDTNQTWDVFAHDRETGVTQRVSVASDGAEGFGISLSPSISGNGRYVTFHSGAPDLVPGDPVEGTYDVFLHDRMTRTTERVSVGMNGMAPDSDSYAPSVTTDGRYIAFSSYASNLIAEPDTNGALNPDVFVRDRVSGTTTRVSESSDGTQGDLDSLRPSMAADGRYVAFYSASSNLVPWDTNGSHGYDVFVHDLEAETTERVSVGHDGTEGEKVSSNPSISADGRYVAFDSRAEDFVPEDSNEAYDVFVRDRELGMTERVSIATDGTQAIPRPDLGPWGADSNYPSMSQDARHVAFWSAAANLVSGDTNERHDVFIRNRGRPIGVGDLAAALQGDRVSVSGWATFSGAVFSSVVDPSGDGGAAAGADLTGASLTHHPANENLLVRLSLESLPEFAGGAGYPAVLYGIRLMIGGVRYEARATGIDSSAPGPALPPSFALYRCDPSCTEQGRLSGGIGTTGNDVLISVPLSVLAAEEGAALTEVQAFTALGESAVEASTTLDEVDLPDATIPVRRVSLGIAPAGVPEGDVAFDIEASLADGNFSGSLDVSSLSSGDLDVWARACLDQDCGSASVPVTTGNGPSPEPSSSPSVSPTPEPTASPQPEVATVAFTEDSHDSGQFSDEARFEARLTDATDDAIEDAELTFELTGAESSRTFTATTDQDGVASVTPTLEERPGPYQLTVRYAGDDSYTGSTDTTVFVIEKEDTDLELTVSGKGKNRTLTARLSDADASSSGVAGRAIDFYADSDLIGSGTTNNDGVATLKAPPRYRGGKHDFEARFGGDDYFRSSSDGRSV